MGMVRNGNLALFRHTSYGITPYPRTRRCHSTQRVYWRAYTSLRSIQCDCGSSNRCGCWVRAPSRPHTTAHIWYRKNNENSIVVARQLTGVTRQVGRRMGEWVGGVLGAPGVGKHTRPKRHWHIRTTRAACELLRSAVFWPFNHSSQRKNFINRNKNPLTNKNNSNLTE